jgi:copper chaperone CopZ
MPETLRLRVASGCCTACAGDVEGALAALPGAEDVQVLARADVITVAHDGRLDEDTVRRVAARHGVTVVSAGEPGGGADSPWWRDRFVLTMALATVLLAVSLVGEYVVSSEAVSVAFGLAT